MRSSIFIFLLIMTAHGTCAGVHGLASARIFFRVVDELDNPVPEAIIQGYSLSTAGGKPELTDTNGVYSYYDRNVYSTIGCTLSKPGYYDTGGDIWVWKNTGDYPTNTLIVVMKRIINPVPMVNRKVKLLFPMLGEPIGFDFAVGDWIEPYGGGKTGDVWITGIRNIRTVGKKDLYASIVASNALDGFVPFPVVRNTDLIKNRSELPPPHLAPESGYTNTLCVYDRFERGHGGESNADAHREFLFRVRCQTNSSGEITHANVGWFCFYESIKLNVEWISEADRLDASKAASVAEKAKKMWISFEYYYNPNPLSRSLEPKEIADRQGKYLLKTDQYQKSNSVQSVKAVEKRVVTGAIADELSQQVRQFMICMREGDTNKYATILADDFRTASGMNRERHLKRLSGRIAEMREQKVEWSDTRVDAVYATEKDNEFLVVVDVVMTRPGEKNVSRQTWTFRNQNNQWFLVLMDR